jgi:flagellar biosynthesis GTPase FlhF
MLKAPGSAGDRLRAQVASVMDKARDRGATVRNAAMEAETFATDAAACDKEDARVQSKRDKKAKRRARKEKEEQAAKRVLAEQRKARISRMVDELEEEEEEEEEEREGEQEQYERSRASSSSHHAMETRNFRPAVRVPNGNAEPQETPCVDSGGVAIGKSVHARHLAECAERVTGRPPPPEAVDPLDVAFYDDMERALQLSAEEATHREVQAALVRNVAPQAPEPEPEPEPGRIAAECVVCLETATHVVSPCGHFCLCETCSKGMAQCPICRGDAQLIIKLFVG